MTHVVQLVGDGDRGGGATYISGLTSQLIKCGYHATIITEAGSFLANHGRALGADVIDLPFQSRSGTVARALTLRRCLDRLEPAIVHAHGLRAGLPTALAALNRPWKFVYSAHGLHFKAEPQPNRSIGWIGERICMRRASTVVFVAAHDRDAARAFGLLSGVAHSLVIPNAADVGIEPEPEANRIYDIGFLGRLVAAKNPLILCDILLAMRPLRPTLLVIGGGVLEAKFRSYVKKTGLEDQCLMTGELPRTEALRALARCRTLVLPSVHEGQPLAVIEAAHLGIPAVASAIDGTQEIIDDGETGYLVSVHDVAGYADRLTRLIGDRCLAERMSLAARRRASVDFCFQRVVDENFRLYGLPASKVPARSDRDLARTPE